MNYLLNLRRQTLPETANISFDEFRDGLADGLAAADYTGPEAEVLTHEMRLTCTQAMLQCLSRSGRVTYVLGDIFELPSTKPRGSATSLPPPTASGSSACGSGPARS